jgi:hypothetical protein
VVSCAGSRPVRLTLTLLLTAAAAASAARGAEVDLSVQRDGQRFHVEAVASMRADARTAWATLTDYAALPRFVPGIHRVDIASRGPAPGGEHLVADFEGRFRLMFFVMPTRVRLDIRHLGASEVQALSLPLPDRPGAPSAALKDFVGTYHLHPGETAADGSARVRLTYRADMTLAQPLPPLVGPLVAGPALRYVLRRQLLAMALEIERRAGAGRAASTGNAAR